MASRKSIKSKATDCAIVSDTGQVRWKELMRKFWKSKIVPCKSTNIESSREERRIQVFATGSKYEGTWDGFGMCGYGTYTFPDGVIYEGDIESNEFHGEGEMRYETGTTLRVKFEQGVTKMQQFVFSEGLEYEGEEWKYCQYPDRRYTIEYESGIQPAGATFLTASYPNREIPPGYYDCGDGFYQTKTRTVFNYYHLNMPIRSPSLAECKWIEANCRSCDEKCVGPRPDLYEEWQTPALEPEPLPDPAAITAMIIEMDDDDDYNMLQWRLSRCSESTNKIWKNRSLLKFTPGFV